MTEQNLLQGSQRLDAGETATEVCFLVDTEALHRPPTTAEALQEGEGRQTSKATPRNSALFFLFVCATASFWLAPLGQIVWAPS